MGCSASVAELPSWALALVESSRVGRLGLLDDDGWPRVLPVTYALSAGVLVSAGHIHNYERNVQDDVVYLVSGGGGAHPYPVERTPNDLYQDNGFPNFHYVKLVLEIHSSSAQDSGQ